MQFQVQKIVDVQKTEAERDQLDLFVGLRSPLNDPFNVFLRVDDIENNNIYFYAYSLGKKKVIIWGIFDRSTNEFLIDEACKYHPNDLKGLIEAWKKQKYSFFFSSVRDRIKGRMTQNLMFNNRADRVALLKSFKQLYMQKLINNGIIPGKYVKMNDNEYLKILEKVANAGKEAIRSDNFKSNPTYNKSLDIIFGQLDTENREKVKKAVYSGSLGGLTPYQANVTKHIWTHLFLLIFLDIDEYRIAKYMQFLD